MYILQLDDYMIFYIPSSGKKRIHRLGGKAADSTVLSDKNSMIHLSVHLMADTSQSVTFAISPFTTLDTVLRQLCIPRERANSGPTEGHMIHSARSAPSERTLLGEKVIAAAGERAAHASASSVGSSGNPSSAGGSLGSSSESDGSERGNGPRDNNSNTNSLTRKKKFNSVSKMHAKITFLESTANFYPELSHWLDFFANKAAEDGGSSGAATSGGTQAQSGPSSNPTIVSPLSRPQIKRGHRRSKSSSNSQGQGTVNPLSFAFFAKRTTSEHRSSATFIPLTERMKGTIYECFTAQVQHSHTCTLSHTHTCFIGIERYICAKASPTLRVLLRHPTNARRDSLIQDSIPIWRQQQDHHPLRQHHPLPLPPRHSQLAETRRQRDQRPGCPL